MINRFVLNEVSYFGPGARKVLPQEIARLGLHKAFVATDKDLLKFGVADKVLKVLEEAGIPYTVFSDIKPNPTVANVQAGVKAYAESGADFILAIGGGSSIDTSKAIGIITNNEIIISVCYHKTELLPDFIRYSRRKELVVRHKYDLILRLIHSSAVWFLKYLKQINNEVARAEKALEKSIRNEDLLRLMKLEKSMVYFNTSIRGNEVMLSKLQSIFQEPMYMDAELLEDVETELKQAHLTVNIYSDILTGTMDAFASIISNNVNTIMKRMTSISIILMVPTLIASFYGMNVVNYIEDAPHGLIAIVLLSITLSALAFFIFRKIKWF